MNQTQYAKHRGISQARLSKLISQGKLKGAVKKKRGKNTYSIDPDKADAVLETTLDPINRPAKVNTKKKAVKKEEKFETLKKAGITGIDYHTARTLNEQYKAALKKLEYEEKKGKQVDASKIAEKAFVSGRMIKEQLASISVRCSALVAAEDDAFKCKKIIDNEIAFVLENLSETLKAI